MNTISDIVKRRLLIISIILISFSSNGQTRSSVFLNPDSFYYAKTDFLKIDSLSCWFYVLLDKNLSYPDSIQPIGQLILQRGHSLKGWTPNFTFQIFNIKDSSYCFRKSYLVRKASDCQPPNVAGDIVIIDKYIFLNTNLCLQCNSYDNGMDYCRPIINKIFSSIEKGKTNTLKEIVQQFPIQGQIINLPSFSEDNLPVAHDSRAKQNLYPKVSTEKVDTVKMKGYTVTAKPDIFETAFFAGTQVKVDTFRLSFYSVNIGKINVESGRIIACDPIGMQDAQPFSQTFPIGQFPIQLSIAKIKSDERVAFSRIFFSNKPVVKWEFALQEGQEQIPLDSETLYGYSVDGGIGLFIDQKASDEFNELYKKDENIWEDAFTNEMDKHYHNTWQYTLYKFGGHNLASFSTGYGDGTYGTYVGYDDNGNICRLLTDFGLVEWWKK